MCACIYTVTATNATIKVKVCDLTNKVCGWAESVQFDIHSLDCSDFTEEEIENTMAESQQRLTIVTMLMENCIDSGLMSIMADKVKVSCRLNIYEYVS